VGCLSLSPLSAACLQQFGLLFTIYMHLTLSVLFHTTKSENSARFACIGETELQGYYSELTVPLGEKVCG
jgi:hypothetical protein